MSLVAYGSSGEESEEESIESTTINSVEDYNDVKQTQIKNSKLCLPAPKSVTRESNVDDDDTNKNLPIIEESSQHLSFTKLPKPKNVNNDNQNIVEEDDIIPPKTKAELCEAPLKKERGPVKISIPCLSEFKDVDEELTKRNKAMPSKKGTGLFALLPPPKADELIKSNSLIPRVLNKVPEANSRIQGQSKLNVKTNVTKTKQPMKFTEMKKSLDISQYESNSEDEDDTNANNTEQSPMDFFSLTTNDSVEESQFSKESLLTETLTHAMKNNTAGNMPSHSSTSEEASLNETNVNKTLVSNIMNLPKEEILLKNKAEVGPKLPVPEQEYNVDSEGNVAFDEKAIEYLCGKRGVKRKEKEMDQANFIEINGEDIKPDEREWLVKALTEEPVQRPVSMHSSGMNTQSKKKHQITYLAQQAKAMEVELKNQWAQNRMSRKQTQSKYGF